MVCTDLHSEHLWFHLSAYIWIDSQVSHSIAEILRSELPPKTEPKFVYCLCFILFMFYICMLHNVKTTWKKFKELILVYSSRHLSFKTRGRVYSSCVRSAMLQINETWLLTKPSLQRLQRNDRAMIRQICNVKPQDTANIRSTELLARLSIEDLDLILKERRLSWYGHAECSNGAAKTAIDIQIVGKRGPGRPKTTWMQLTERGCREWKLTAIDPHDRGTWRSGVRSTTRAASQLPGRGATVVDIAPVPAR